MQLQQQVRGLMDPSLQVISFQVGGGQEYRESSDLRFKIADAVNHVLDKDHSPCTKEIDIPEL